MSDRHFDPKNAIYTPLEVSKYGLEAVVNARNNMLHGVGIGIAEIRDYFAPVMPGQVCAIQGQTSNYKSGFLHYIEHEAARQLIKDNRMDEILIHVSVEECVEEQAFLEFSRYSGDDPGKLARGICQDWNKLEKASTVIDGIPIYRLGDSIARADEIPNLYMSNMIRSIDLLAKGGVTGRPMKIAGIFFDYLQAFPIDPEVRQTTIEGQRRLQVRQDYYRLRQASKYFACPIFVAVQAKQALTGSKHPIYMPGQYDCEETSAVGQRSDRIVSLWMPKMNHPVGSSVTFGGLTFTVEDNLLFIKVNKQRGGLPSGKTWMCHIDYSTNNIIPIKNGATNINRPSQIYKNAGAEEVVSDDED